MTATFGSAPLVVDLRRHVHAADWDDNLATDYHMAPSAAQISGTGNREDLSDVGWTIVGLAGQYVPGVSADFLVEGTLGVPRHFVTTAALDRLQSPDIFGGFVHGDESGHILGRDAVKLTVETWAAFSVNGSNETATGFGLSDAGGNILTATDAIAVIHSNGSNFVCRSSADSDVGAAVDTNWHEWKIVISKGTTDAIEWFIDDVSQGTLNLRTGVFPASWGGGVVNAGSNRVLLGTVHIAYD